DALPEDQSAAAHALVYRPLRHPDGPPQHQVEYKLRRFVNDYVAPPKTAAKLEIALESFQRMREEIAGMGAGTPHELMRCVEVDFIRDCAEMAARASLTRTESRWGLYHQRADLPARDDDAWLFHLNLRKRGDGAMEFVKRPVEPYLVPVPEFTPAAAEPVTLGAHTAATVRRATTTRAGRTAVGRSPRILELHRLAEEQPTAAQLAPYLSDPDPKVRRAAIATLTEIVPEGVGAALAAALGDVHGTVRRAAATALKELVEVLPATAELGAALAGRLDGEDAVVRACAFDVLRALRLGDRQTFAAGLADADRRVRIEAIRGLVSLDEADLVATAATDPSREVRVWTARGLGLIGKPSAVLAALAADADPLVRAAALEASGATGAPLETQAAQAIRDPDWQVRVGAARCLAAADVDVASGPLIG